MKKTRKPQKTITTLTDDAIAQRYGVAPRTVRRWRAAGAPLGDDKEMERWISSRRQIPPGALPGLAKARLEEVLERVRRLRRENEVAEGTLVRREWVCEKIQAMCAGLRALEARSIEELPLRLAGCGDDVAAHRSALRTIWDEIRDGLQALGEHLKECDE